MPYALAAGGGLVACGLRSGRLFVTDDLGARWREAEVVGADLWALRSLHIVGGR
jgi:hypothetical protein